MKPGMVHQAPPQSPPQQLVVINNTVSAPTPFVISAGPNHALHLVLTLLTCGMWLPVWLIVAIASPSRTSVAGRPSSNTAMSHPAVFVGLVMLAGLGFFGYRAYGRANERRAEQASIAARADGQHQAFMSGEPWGTYGRYPPMPPPHPR